MIIGITELQFLPIPIFIFIPSIKYKKILPKMKTLRELDQYQKHTNNKQIPTFCKKYIPQV